MSETRVIHWGHLRGTAGYVAVRAVTAAALCGEARRGRPVGGLQGLRPVQTSAKSYREVGRCLPRARASRAAAEGRRRRGRAAGCGRRSRRRGCRASPGPLIRQGEAQPCCEREPRVSEARGSPAARNRHGGRHLTSGGAEAILVLQAPRSSVGAPRRFQAARRSFCGRFSGAEVERGNAATAAQRLGTVG